MANAAARIEAENNQYSQYGTHNSKGEPNTVVSCGNAQLGYCHISNEHTNFEELLDYKNDDWYLTTTVDTEEYYQALREQGFLLPARSSEEVPLAGLQAFENGLQAPSIVSIGASLVCSACQKFGACILAACCITG